MLEDGEKGFIVNLARRAEHMDCCRCVSICCFRGAMKHLFRSVQEVCEMGRIFLS